MRSIEEGHLRFEFDSTWNHIEKWDDSSCFNNGIACVAGIGALDIVAFSRERKECLLLEIKDFRDLNARALHDRGSRKRKPANEPEPPTEAQVASQLTEKVAQKLVGTIAGLVGAARMQDEAFAQDLAKTLADRTTKFRVRVVLWVEGEPTSKGQSPRSKVNLATLNQALKRQVLWLTKSPVQVLSSASPPIIPGLTVIDSRP